MIKFLVFSDLHYDDTADGERRTVSILKNAQRRQVDFIVSLGDLCRPCPENKKVLDRLNSLGVPFYPVIGNHETDEFDLSSVKEFYSLPGPYYSVLHGDYRLIFMNTCYLLNNGAEKAYYKKNFKSDSAIYPIVPAEEVRWLKKELHNRRKTIIFSHHSFANDFAKRGVANRADMQRLFRDSSVALCLNGHDHGDSFSVLDRIPYMTVNSANYAWLGTQIASSRILTEKYSHLHGILQYEQAMSAYVEADDREIRIFGESGNYVSVTPEDIGLPDYQWNGVSVRPEISTHRIVLKAAD